ncbi:DUF2157 domain-containing protein [Tepidiforma bonchosmolovskayae]|uniref:DUF2157 domain-containing protein n=1 Tax=Tepidiforma bonchosmolovskayae TaxID=2601677 RepID=A0ABX6BZG9_9CHLR|nr:DUF2157 domain-containing protein [Tepidiforma bonchosmolovskayae]QFG02405.1 DUF2157 domain-containing protein [Tepidiforma bonchosmolovskayae]
MSELDADLRRWVEAGILDPQVAERIRAFEAARTAPAHPAAERPDVIEVLLYLGIAVLAVGVFALAAQNWGDLASPARVAVTAVPAAFTLLLGALLRDRPEPGMRRAGQLAWTAAVGLTALALGVYIWEYEPFGLARDEDATPFLVVTAAATGLALLLWAVTPSVLQLLTLGVSLFFLAQAIGRWPDEYSAPLAGGSLAIAALAAIALTETGRLVPRAAARTIFGLLLAVGAYQPGFSSGGTPWEIPAFLAAAGLLALGVWRSSFQYVLWGVLLLFVALVRAIFQNFSDQLGAPVALIISGVLLIGAVLLLARLAPQLRRGVAA